MHCSRAVPVQKVAAHHVKPFWRLAAQVIRFGQQKLGNGIMAVILKLGMLTISLLPMAMPFVFLE